MAKAAKKKKRTQSVQEALEQVRALLQKHRIVEEMVHKQDMPRHELVESLWRRWFTSRTCPAMNWWSR